MVIQNSQYTGIIHIADDLSQTFVQPLPLEATVHITLCPSTSSCDSGMESPGNCTVMVLVSVKSENE